MAKTAVVDYSCDSTSSDYCSNYNCPINDFSLHGRNCSDDNAPLNDNCHGSNYIPGAVFVRAIVILLPNMEQLLVEQLLLEQLLLELLLSE